MGIRLLPFAVMLSMAVMTSASSTAEEDENSSPAQQGFEISPIPNGQGLRCGRVGQLYRQRARRLQRLPFVSMVS
jgi:hypothetical protein